MLWYHWLATLSAVICLSSCIIHTFKVIRAGKPKDYAKPSGDVSASVRYSFTGAMHPAKKESAYMHLPTYIGGLLYHMGTFLSLFLLILLSLGLYPSGILTYILVAVFSVTAVSGLAILLKRISSSQLRALSNPDDYLSNILVSLFQLATVALLLSQDFVAVYYVSASLLLLYIPLGKLKHLVYFFAARYHLGIFFGSRNVWPSKQS